MRCAQKKGAARHKSASRKFARAIAHRERPPRAYCSAAARGRAQGLPRLHRCLHELPARGLPHIIAPAKRPPGGGSGEAAALLRLPGGYLAPGNPRSRRPAAAAAEPPPCSGCPGAASPPGTPGYLYRPRGRATSPRGLAGALRNAPLRGAPPAKSGREAPCASQVSRYARPPHSGRLSGPRRPTRAAPRHSVECALRGLSAPLFRATSRPAAPASPALVRFGPCAPAAATRSPPRRRPGPGAAPRLFRSGTCAGSASLRPPRPLAPLRLPSGSASFRSALPGGRAALCSASPVCSAQLAGPPLPRPFGLRARRLHPRGGAGLRPAFFAPPRGFLCSRARPLRQKRAEPERPFGRQSVIGSFSPAPLPSPPPPLGAPGRRRPTTLK